MPIIMIPINFDTSNKNNRSIVIRTIITDNFMTGLVANLENNFDLLEKMLKEMVREMMKIDGISRVCYDLTSKPTCTTEWL